MNLAFRMTGSESASHDLLQDIFMKVYENLESFRSEANVYSWIYRIALNHITNHVNRERQVTWFQLLTDEQEEREEPVDESAPWKPSGSMQPDSVLEAKERETLVHKLIMELKPEYRIPLVLNRYEDQDYQSIADALGLTLSTVETRIFRAKKMLAEKLRPWIGKI